MYMYKEQFQENMYIILYWLYPIYVEQVCELLLHALKSYINAKFLLHVILIMLNFHHTENLTIHFHMYMFKYRYTMYRYLPVYSL